MATHTTDVEIASESGRAGSALRLRRSEVVVECR